LPTDADWFSGTGCTRRDALRAGTLGGLSLPALLKSSAARGSNVSDPTFGRAKNCIVLFLLGGPPQHETFDPKPGAPSEIRGEIKPIATSLPGYGVGELMPRTARWMDRLTVLRAMATDDNTHSSSGYYMLTGRPHAPKNLENARAGFPNDWPSFNAMMRSIRPDANGIPSSIVLPDNIWNDGNIAWPGQDAGRLGRWSDPWLIRASIESPGFHVPGLSLPAELAGDRLNDRLALRQALDAQHAPLEQKAATGSFDTWSEQALALLRSSKVEAAFHLDREPEAIRDRYGRGRFGQSTLMARRLIEAGVSLVQVNWTRIDGKVNSGGWDTHQKHTEALRTVLMDPMDQAFTALLDDLEQRGMLDETVVLWTGEFGRSPRFNALGGRDHWGHVFSVALAGAGLKRGYIHGASDKIGAYPIEGRVRPEDLMATLFHLLGYSPEQSLTDTQGRPFPICEGEVVRSILA
jgi:hypothetical protein